MFAQNHKADSLKTVLAHSQQDSDRINALLSLAAQLETINPDSSILLSRQSLVIAHKLAWGKGIVSSQYDLGVFLYVKGDMNNALIYVDSSLAASDKYNFHTKLNSIYNMLGNITSEQNKYAIGLDYYFKALAIDTISGKKSGADLYNNIGLNYQEMGNYVKAIEYYFKSEKINEANNDQEGIATICTNIGNLYELQGEYQKGLEVKFKAFKIDSTFNNKENLLYDYQNIGHSYLFKKDFAKVLTYTFKSIALSKSLGITAQIYASYSNIGEAFIELYIADSTSAGFTYMVNGTTLHVTHSGLLDSSLLYEQKCITAANLEHNRASLIPAYKVLGDIYDIKKDQKQSILFYQRAYDLADSLNVLQDKMEESKVLGHAFARNGDYKSAVKYLDNALGLKDSLFGEEKQKAIGNIESQYEFDKKLLEQKKEHEKEQAVAEEQEKRQKYVIATVSLGFGVVLIFLTLLFRRYRLTNRQKKIIETQKKDVDAAYGQLNNAHAQLQEKDKDITDSIAYARKIQSAILPSEESLKEELGECFVLYKPRDIVSGDFYWFHSLGTKMIFAVVDCTGHGVPGAFMSMIGNSILNQVVIEDKASTTSEILGKMRSNLLKQLQQKGQEAVSRDGMDMSVCIWDKDKNTLQYSGANNPLYLVRKNINNAALQNLKMRPHGNDMIELLPDKQPIGYQEGKMESEFNTQTIQLQKGDMVYIASDGYHDQFGGEKNKKFTSRAFRDLLVSLNGKSVEQQKIILDGTIETWKANYAQTDDICVMGVKIS